MKAFGTRLCPFQEPVTGREVEAQRFPAKLPSDGMPPWENPGTGNKAESQETILI